MDYAGYLLHKDKIFVPRTCREDVLGEFHHSEVDKILGIAYSI